ncbi:bacteriodes thetaiotaomicron symbiotic chitinase [Cordyceps javanica]|nr:bacteriodes thetaiotaomicron symbiotic chitinase [Cordyceps javanica]
MGLDEIPVELLTHLNVAFGYISEDFRITNMDGISDDLYRNMGNVKARNPGEISVSDKNILYSSPEHGGVVVLQTILEFGVDIYIERLDTQKSPPIELMGISGTMSAGHTASASYRYYPGDLAHYNKSCIDYSWGDNLWQTTGDSGKLGWSSSSVFELYHDEKTPEDAEVCYAEPDDGREGYMPGWGYGSGSNIDPTTFVGADNQGSVPLPDVFLDSEINCDNCVSCNSADDLTKKRKRSECCGCVNLDIRFGYNDIGECLDCENDDGFYPGDGSALASRKSGTATLSYKWVQVCGADRFTLRAPYRYPAFPAQCTYPWDHIENNKWDSIARYWGNSSMSCDNWSTMALQDADQRDIGGKMCRAKYNTEHVFEAQLISDFFTLWLDKGTITKPMPAVQGPMFSGSRAVAKDKYIGMDVEEQLLAIKDMGMVFTYTNDPKVWDAFCKTYEAMYKHMENYNDWWVNTQESTHGKIPKLQDMFKEYMQVVLRSFCNRAQDEFAWAYNQRAADAVGTYLPEPVRRRWQLFFAFKPGKPPIASRICLGAVDTFAMAPAVIAATGPSVFT